MRYRLFLLLLGVSAQTCLGAPSAITVVGSRSELIDAQSLDWTQLAPAGNLIGQPFVASTNLGYQVTVYKNNSNTPYIRADEGNGFLGDFSLGEPLLFSTSLTAIDLKFDPPIMAVGGDLQRAVFISQSTWTPYIYVKRSDGPDISFSLPDDVNNALENGTAPFAGIQSESATITEVLFDSLFGGNTAIDHLSVIVPEPNYLAVLAVGVSVAARARRKRI